MPVPGICISQLTAWAPGITTADDWKQWAAGNKQMLAIKDAPKLEYTDPLFRRRLSQISRMTIEVIHNELEKGCSRDMKQVFVSCRGELVREFSVSKMLIEEKAVLPASFSLSVFNTPIALATLAFKLTGGYSVIYPSKGSFRDAFAGACAPVLSGAEPQILLVYADELPPEEYAGLGTERFMPFAFAAVLSAGKGTSIPDISAVPETAESFLSSMIQKDTQF